MSTHTKRAPSHGGVLTLDKSPDGADYTLKPQAQSVWITVGDLSVYVRRTDRGGVAVAIWPVGKEANDEELITSCET